MTLPFDAALNRLRDSFLSHHFSRHDQLEVLLDAIRNGSAAATAAADAEAVLHKIGGAAGSLGLGDLGQAASLTENFIRLHLACPEPDFSLIGDAVDAFLDISLQVCNPTAWPATRDPAAAHATETTAA